MSLAGDPFASARAVSVGTSSSQGPALLHRRTLLIAAGGGVVTVSGLAVATKHWHLLARLRSKFSTTLQGLGVGPADARPPFPDGPLSTTRDLVIFNGSLGTGWQDWSWAKRRLPDTSAMHEGQAAATFDANNWTGLYLHGGTFDTTGYIYVQCWVRGADAGGQAISVWLVNAANAWVGGALLGEYTREGGITRGEWRLARIPLETLRAAGIKANGLIFQAASAQNQGAVNLADVRLVYYPTSQRAALQRLWMYDLSTITLAFSAPLDPSGLALPAAYTLAPEGSTATNPRAASHPRAVRYHPNPHTISMVMPQPLTPKATYAVTVDYTSKRTGAGVSARFQGTVQVTSNPLALTGDAAANRHGISRDIYGASGLDGNLALDLGAKLRRWGGEQTTRYNWKLGNAFNASRDYYFENGNYNLTSDADQKPSGVADQDIADAHKYDMRYLLTIPTIGWVAKDDNADSRSVDVPDSGGPPFAPGADAIPGYDPTANRQRTSTPSRARKGAPFTDPPDLSDPTVAQDEWIYHLVRRFGRASAGGVKYYAMDNEPELWWYQQTDIKPAQLSYDQMRDIFLEYATAIKDVDPTALIVAPTMWYYFNLFYSPLDRDFPSRPDRRAHGDMPFLDWWLSEIRKHDEATGRRTLDVFAMHPYPQGNVYSDDVSPNMAALRLRSTRTLWDPNYTEESWIKDKMRLIPRLRDAIAANYPGTKIGMTEYSWGALGSVNGGLALAEVLGIFGREGVEVAAHWGGFTPGSPTYNAFKLYGNYDSAGSAFADTSFLASSTNDGLLSCYGAQASGSGALLLMVLNKSLDSDITPTIHLANARAALGGAEPRRMRVWRFWPDDAAEITRGDDVALPASASSTLALSYTFPASSITLLRIEAGG